jgi:hypothetical protein
MKSCLTALLVLGALCALPGTVHAQGARLSETALKVADINRRIEDQKSRNTALSLAVDKLRADSAAAHAAAGRHIDSLSGAIAELAARSARETAAQTLLRDKVSSFTTTKASREAERAAAADSMHRAVAAFEPAANAWKDSADAAKAGLDLARADSADCAKRISLETAAARDSLFALERFSAAAARRADSCAARLTKLAYDSSAAAAVKSDSAAAAQKRLADMRRLLAVKDSAVQGATEELNNSKRDSLAAQAENLKESRKRERDLATLDSLVPALQDEKNRLFRIRETFLLDSAIEAISAQLGDFLNKPYEVRSEATGPDAEKAQTLDFDKGKLETAMRDEAFAALVAKIPGSSWRDRNARVGALIGRAQTTLDSATAQRERIVREGVLSGKQFSQVIANFAVRNKRLSDRIATTWKDVINAKPRLAKMERDTAAALIALHVSQSSFQEAHVSLMRDSAAAAFAADSVRRVATALTATAAGRETVHLKSISNASLAVAQAAGLVRHAQTALDAVRAKQQAARDDSARVFSEKSVFVTQAAGAIDAKQEELRREQSAVDALAGDITRAKSDSAAAARDRLEQESAFASSIAGRRAEAHKGELALPDLETERDMATAAPQPAAAPPPQAPPLADQPPHAPVKQRAQPVEVTDQAAREAAQRQLMLLYDLIDKGKTDAARRAFSTNRKLLEKNLDPEAFQAMQATVETPEPGLPQAAVQPAAAAADSATFAASPVAAASSSPEPDADRKEATVFISSVPPVASIYMDGKLVGKTNTGYAKVTSGKHTMQFVKGDTTCTREMTFAEGSNPAIVVKLPCGQ